MDNEGVGRIGGTRGARRECIYAFRGTDESVPHKRLYVAQRGKNKK